MVCDSFFRYFAILIDYNDNNFVPTINDHILATFDHGEHNYNDKLL